MILRLTLNIMFLVLVSKPPSESGETESESDSDSDSEPRMTLSERFAKLSQMSTDKREMAKPVLAVNEIDTKMRVVKDFRNPEAPKVYVAGDTGSQPADKSYCF
jgi:Ribonuclease G/E